MSIYKKVVWSEGLFLRPQHFQQQDRHIERYIETRCEGLTSYSWGFTEFQLESDLLSIGKFGLRRVVGVFPDGTPFRLPDDHPLPAPIDIDETVRGQVVYLAIPLRRSEGLEAERVTDGTGVARYQVSEVETHDATLASGGVERLEVGALSTRLLLESDATTAYACLPVAHIVECHADKRVQLDDEFIPSVLHVRAASRLVTLTTELLGLFHQRGDALGGRAAATGRGATAEVADFLMLQAINRCEPQLAHLASTRVAHPEALFRFCLSAAGELATFTTTSKRPPEFPVYRHDKLRESFEPVVAALRASLRAVLEQTAVPIPLESKKYGIRVAVVPDPTLYSTAVFILAARADLPAEELRRRFPAQLKIGPVEKISELVNLQLPGVSLSPVPAAPRQLPFHAGFVYFEFDQTSELWGALKISGGLAMHLAGEFPGLGLECWAIRR